MWSSVTDKLYACKWILWILTDIIPVRFQEPHVVCSDSVWGGTQGRGALVEALSGQGNDHQSVKLIARATISSPSAGP